MTLRILFLTTAHRHNDDRIYYHQAAELFARGYQVKICSLCSDFVGQLNGIEIESQNILEQDSETKIQTFLRISHEFQPDIVICSEPLAVLAAHRYRKKNKVSVIYDITEWYPSISMLRPYSLPMKWIHGIKFLMIQLYAGFLSTHFIFGEETKKFPLAHLFPWKKKMTLPYYPDKRFVQESVRTLDQRQITLCITGELSKEKGFGNFMNVINLLKERHKNLNVKVLIIGSARTAEDEIYVKQQLKTSLVDSIEYGKPTSFENFTQSFSEADLCFDLRSFNFENHHSLPIKLFYYIGAGKPVIYSALKGIREHIGPMDFGFLVNPDDTQSIVEHIEQYIGDRSLYVKHCENARTRFLEEFNWSKISGSFIGFITEAAKTAR